MQYLNKDLSTYSLPQLQVILSGLQAAEDRRNEASKHPKFDKSTKKGMDFPPPNPELLKLKLAIEEELRKRKNA